MKQRPRFYYTRVLNANQYLTGHYRIGRFIHRNPQRDVSADPENIGVRLIKQETISVHRNLPIRLPARNVHVTGTVDAASVGSDKQYQFTKVG